MKVEGLSYHIMSFFGSRVWGSEFRVQFSGFRATLLRVLQFMAFPYYCQLI